MNSISEKEELIKSYVDRGDKEAAVKSLGELVAVFAEQKDFEAAEATRSRIFEIDPMALGEIIRSGEIIEEKKREAIDKSHREIWAGLYDSLSVEEGNVLYFSFTNATYQAGETIFQQGEWKPRLYFINSGKAKIVYSREGREVFLKAVEAGQVGGEDTFFSIAVCTTTMVADSRMEVSYLDSDILKQWKTTAPVLEYKLQGYSSSVQKVPDLLKAMKMDRRRQRRVNIEDKAMALLMSSSGDPVGKPFKVDLSDISRGGLSFMVRITKTDTARLLLGKRVSISCSHPQMDPAHSISQSGIIVGVKFHPFADCTVNVKFDTLLPEKLIEQLKPGTSL